MLRAEAAEESPEPPASASSKQELAARRRAIRCPSKSRGTLQPAEESAVSVTDGWSLSSLLARAETAAERIPAEPFVPYRLYWRVPELARESWEPVVEQSRIVVVRPPVSAALEPLAMLPVQPVSQRAAEPWRPDAELLELSPAAVLPFRAGAIPRTPAPLP